MAQTLGRKMNSGFTNVLGEQDVRVRRNLRDLSFLYTALFAVLLILAMTFAYLWSRLAVVNLGYEISKANTERNSLIEQNRRLRIDFMKLKSPERVEKIAAAELNLVHPKGNQIIKLR